MMLNSEKHFTYHFFDLPPEYDSESLFVSLRNDNSDASILQLIDPEYLVSEKQIAIGLYHVEKVFENNSNISNKKETELLLRLAGKRQIKKALKQFGIKNKTEYVLVITFGGTVSQNSQKLTKFIQEHKLEKYKQENICLPISPLPKLAKYYDASTDMMEIEKKALERMAYLSLE